MGHTLTFRPTSPIPSRSQPTTPCLPQNPSRQPKDHARTSLTLTVGPRSQPLSPLHAGRLGALTCGVRMSDLPPISRRVRNRHCPWHTDSGDSSTEPSPATVNRGLGPARSWSPRIYKCRAPQTPARVGSGPRGRESSLSYRTLGCVLAKRDLGSHGESPGSVEHIRGLAVCGVALCCREFTVGIHLCHDAACGRGQPSVRHRLW
jgi:hypothetical protein